MYGGVGGESRETPAIPIRILERHGKRHNREAAGIERIQKFRPRDTPQPDHLNCCAGLAILRMKRHIADITARPSAIIGD